MYLDRRRQNSCLEHVGELAHFLARAFECLLPRHVVNATHFRECADVLHRSGDVFYIRAVAQKGPHLDALLDLVERLPDVDRDQREQSEGKK